MQRKERNERKFTLSNPLRVHTLIQNNNNNNNNKTDSDIKNYLCVTAHSHQIGFF